MDQKAQKQPRRRRSKQERRRIVEQSYEPGLSVARLARTHEVNANQIFHWRKLYREGLLEDEPSHAAAEWLPVRLSDVAAEQPRQQTRGAVASGAIEIELARGRVRIEGAAEPATLRLVLEALQP